MPEQQTELQIPKGAENIIQPGYIRFFAQGGATPTVLPRDPTKYKGRTRTGDSITNASSEPSTIVDYDDSRPGQTKILATVPGAEEPQTLTLSQHMTDSLDGGWNALQNSQYELTLSAAVGQNRNPSDPNDWAIQVLMPRSRITSFSALTSGVPAAAPGESPNANASGMEAIVSYPKAYFNEAMRFSQPLSGTTTLAEDIKAIGYRKTDQGIEIFALQDADGTSNAATILVRNHLGYWKSVAVLGGAGGLTGSDTVDDMVVIGGVLIIISNDDEGHIVASLDDLIAGTDNAQKVGAGYVASKMPNAIFAKSAGQIIIVGDGGFVYNSESPLAAVTPVERGVATTQNLLCVHGFGKQVVAGGAANSLIKSSDNGVSWEAVTMPSGQSSASVSAVHMPEKDIIFIGYNDGKLFYSLDFGDTFTQVNHGMTDLTSINDIMFVNDEPSMGFFVGATASAGIIARSTDHGHSWHDDPPYIGAQISGAAKLSSLSIIDYQHVIVGGAAASDGILGVCDM